MTRIWVAAMIGAVLGALLSACGYKGALYLPDRPPALAAGGDAAVAGGVAR